MTTENGAKRTRVAILVESHFEDSEFQLPYKALKNAGAEVIVLGTRMNDEYKGKKGKVSIKPDATATEVRSEDFDAVIIPGGAAPDKIRRNPNAVRLVMNAVAQGKLVASVCHGAQVLIEADQLRGKQATGFSCIRKDMQNAGATYVNEPLVVDGNLITSRQPGDLPLFVTAILTRLGLSVEGSTPPDTGDTSYEWWKLGAAWGGSSRDDIVKTLNIAFVGERYTSEAFQEYANKTTDPELKLVIQEIINSKQRHVGLLEKRLNDFGEDATWQAAGSDAFARLQGWLQSSDDREIMRRALGDLQTGIVDGSGLSASVTDPATAAILDEIAENLSRHEARLSDLYRARMGETVMPPQPTTVPAS